MNRVIVKKGENGIISCYVLIIMLFMYFVSIKTYHITSNKVKLQLEIIEKTLEIYDENVAEDC